MSDRRRTIAWTLGWVVAAVMAVTVGVVAVTTVGASIRGRGPLGANDEVIRDIGNNANGVDNSSSLTPDPRAEAVRKPITGEFGAFVVECRGVVALGIEVQPDTAAGWGIVSFEPGPDDDVDAVFANRGRSIELEVFCPRGQPTVDDIEYNQLPDDD